MKLFASRLFAAPILFLMIACAPGAPLPELCAAEPAKGPERWKAEIDKMVAADAKNPPAKGGVLFLGSSSIRLWDLEKAFPEKDYVNHGFGGSQIADSLRYLDQLVFPYEPKAIVFYAGDNDLANGKSPEQVAGDFEALSERVAKRLPETRILYIAIKPSIKRWALYDKVQDANSRIARHCEETPNRQFVDVAPPMLGDDGLPKKELFVADGLHMTPAGYAIWNKLVGEALAEGEKPSAE